MRASNTHIIVIEDDDTGNKTRDKHNKSYSVILFVKVRRNKKKIIIIRKTKTRGKNNKCARAGCRYVSQISI